MLARILKFFFTNPLKITSKKQEFKFHLLEGGYPVVATEGITVFWQGANAAEEMQGARDLHGKAGLNYIRWVNFSFVIPVIVTCEEDIIRSHYFGGCPSIYEAICQFYLLVDSKRRQCKNNIKNMSVLGSK